MASFSGPEATIGNTIPPDLVPLDLITECLGTEFITIHVPVSKDVPTLVKYVVHKRLLCLSSRYFHLRFRNSMHPLYVSTIRARVFLKDEALVHVPSDDELRSERSTTVSGDLVLNPHLRHESQDGSAESSSETIFEPQNPPDEDVGTTIDDNEVVLLQEESQIFSIFIHWLYAKDLLPVVAHVKGNKENVAYYVLLYALAERLDVPELRQECYDLFGEHYRERYFPSLKIFELVIRHCTQSSKLRSYLVQLCAFQIEHILPGEDLTPVLELDTSFAADVAKAITGHFRAGHDREETHPYEEEAYRSDDSDPTYSFSESEAESDTDVDMEIPKEEIDTLNDPDII